MLVVHENSSIMQIVQQSYKEHPKNIGDMYEHYKVIMKFHIYKNEVMNRDDLTEKDVLEIQRDLADGVYELDIPSFADFCTSLNEYDFFFEVGTKVFHPPTKRVW